MKKGHKRLITGGAIVVVVIIVLLGTGVIPLGNIPGPSPEPEQEYSQIFVYDQASVENLKELCPMTILGNDEVITETSDIYDLANYKSIVTAKMPEDINNLKLDFSPYDYVIFITNPNEATEGYWARDYQVTRVSGNGNFTFYAKHESSDIYGSVLDRDSGSAWAKNTNGNFSIFAWFPYDTTTELHWKEGGKWTYDGKWADYSTATKDKLKNENLWRCRSTRFDMNDDKADHEKVGDYLTITDTTAIEIDFNATIGSSGSDTAINFTVDCDIDYLVEYGAGADSDKLYIVFTETWDCVQDNFRLDFEIEFKDPGKFIIASSVKIGDMNIPGRYFYDYSPTFASIQTLA